MRLITFNNFIWTKTSFQTNAIQWRTKARENHLNTRVNHLLTTRKNNNTHCYNRRATKNQTHSLTTTSNNQMAKLQTRNCPALKWIINGIMIAIVFYKKKWGIDMLCSNSFENLLLQWINFTYAIRRPARNENFKH